MLTITVVDEIGKNPRIVCDERESILDAANRQSLRIPYACKGGGCGLCKIKVEEGQFKMLKCSKAVLPDQERELNYTLACKTYPKSHMKIHTDLSKVAEL
ncbi:2Fe-2S iron-sulfur cluster binding domain-containing protein [Bacillus sp. EB600]|uniref:2Fe-2S iron-sulfur cluster-binding protein n=1 Tax=Bacillus sp. EB600 TaxID=2806345 RepID=UPI00210BFDD7|nr:2Fe-2S iron-sulfur cluster binding domain-containing protein [Bacillus sp. EB600]MCQ6282288.1 2Fe-2S iron-sulfur cluster binding domain-containing protein [Bacillus sp. EB600]